MSTAAQIAANQTNAQLSTGPTSETGKSNSSRNALKTALTGRTVLLPTEDADLYEAHLNQFVKRFEPQGDDERNLVQSLADTDWRLLRIPALEMGIYAIGRIELAHLFPNEDPTVREQLIEAKIFLTYQRNLTNLSLQETRLRRHIHQSRRSKHQRPIRLEPIWLRIFTRANRMLRPRPLPHPLRRLPTRTSRTVQTRRPKGRLGAPTRQTGFTTLVKRRKPMKTRNEQKHPSRPRAPRKSYLQESFVSAPAPHASVYTRTSGAVPCEP